MAASSSDVIQKLCNLIRFSLYFAQKTVVNQDVHVEYHTHIIHEDL